MEQAKIDRINELSRKAKAGPLSEEEQRERAALRREYLDAVTGSLRRRIESMVLIDERGQRRKLKQKEE